MIFVTKTVKTMSGERGDWLQGRLIAGLQDLPSERHAAPAFAASRGISFCSGSSCPGAWAWSLGLELAPRRRLINVLVRGHPWPPRCQAQRARARDPASTADLGRCLAAALAGRQSFSRHAPVAMRASGSPGADLSRAPACERRRGLLQGLHAASDRDPQWARRRGEIRSRRDRDRVIDADRRIAPTIRAPARPPRMVVDVSRRQWVEGRGLTIAAIPPRHRATAAGTDEAQGQGDPA